MNKIHPPNKIPIWQYVALGLFLELWMLGLPASAQSQLGARSYTSNRPIVFQENFDPPGDGQPKDTVGAGSRDGLRCSLDEEPIRVLMPERNYGLTLQERPPIFVNLPETSARAVVLTFQEEDGKNYQRAFLPIAKRGGIVSFALPEDKSPLVAGKNYQWSLVVVCNETVQPDDPVFQGWVQRAERSPEVESQLVGKSALEQAQWYGQKGYWYDLIQVMEQARRSNSQEDAEVKQLWQNFLISVGLGAIATTP
jgi:Domain of Unknown Function (DUF928)